MRWLLVSVMATALVATPALAQKDDAGQVQAQPSPELAAAASGLTFPIGGIATGFALYGISYLAAASGWDANGLLGVLSIGTIALSPILTCTGQAYAGDYERAKWVGMGAPAVVALSTVAGIWLMRPSPRLPGAMPNSSLMVGPFIGGVLGYALSGGIYSIWSATDAYSTTVRMNKLAKPEGASP